MKQVVHQCTIIGACLGALFVAPSSQATQQVTAPITLPLSVSLTVSEAGCDNSPGPEITIEGEIAVGSVCPKVIFSNNVKGTHRAEVVREVDAMLSVGENIVIPKQPVLGGVGGNPHVWLQFHDGNGNDLSEEAYLGRCVQGLNVSADLVSEAIARVIVDVSNCLNHQGPFITFGGDLTLSGLHVRLIFRNNAKGTHAAESTADVTLIAEGQKIVLPKQPVRGGVGGNPLISMQFIDCDTGRGMDDAVFLGRCNKL